MPEVASRVMPINSFINVTERLGERKAEKLIKNNFAVADSKFVVNYFKLTPDNRLLFGGAENYRFTFPKNISQKVRSSMIDV